MPNPPKLYIPVPTPVVDGERHITRDWVLLFDQLVGRLNATGTVVGPAGASAASRLLGRGSAAGAGDWEELTVGTGATITGTVVTAKPDDVVLRGTRAAQPAATAVLAGTLYSVTDEDNLLERSNGTTWDVYTETGPAGPTGPTGPTGPAGANGRSVNSWPYIARTGATSGDPGDSKILWNNATQTSATAILIDDLNDETPTFDISLFLALCESQMRLIIQDRNDATQYQRWKITGASTDLGGYWSVPVTLIDSAGGAFANNEQIELGLVWASPSDANETFVLSTDTGTKTAWAPGLYGDTAVQWSGASDLTIQGIAGGTSGQVFRFKNTGSKWAWWTHASGSASASDRLTNLATSSLTPVAPGGWVSYQHDGTNWQLVGHEQGAWITPTYNAADWTAATGSWTVDAGDILIDKYRIDGKTLYFQITVVTTSVSAATATLSRTLYGYTNSNTRFDGLIQYSDAGGGTTGGAFFNNASQTKVFFLRWAGNWSIAVNNNAVIATGLCEVT